MVERKRDGQNQDRHHTESCANGGRGSEYDAARIVRRGLGSTLGRAGISVGKLNTASFQLHASLKPWRSVLTEQYSRLLQVGAVAAADGSPWSSPSCGRGGVARQPRAVGDTPRSPRARAPSREYACLARQGADECGSISRGWVSS